MKSQEAPPATQPTTFCPLWPKLPLLTTLGLIDYLENDDNLIGFHRYGEKVFKISQSGFLIDNITDNLLIWTMYFYFDYFYYRIFKLFKKYPGDMGVRAVVLITMIETSVGSAICGLLSVIFLDKGQIKDNLTFITTVVTGTLLLTLGIFNFLKYQGTYEDLALKWEDEPKIRKTIKGWIIIFSIVTSLLLYYFVTSHLFVSIRE